MQQAGAEEFVEEVEEVLGLLVGLLMDPQGPGPGGLPGQAAGVSLADVSTAMQQVRIFASSNGQMAIVGAYIT